MLRQTYTFVTLDLSDASFNEIKQKLEAASYQHCFIDDGNGKILIDMRGIAVKKEEES
jgi:hypothetical protein